MQNFYDKYYETSKMIFGAKPDNCLSEHADKLPEKSRILDIGAGQGRNSFYLLEKGFSVDVIDTSAVAIQDMKNRAGSNFDLLRTYHQGFENFNVETKYNGILVFGLIPDLNWSQITRLLNKIPSLCDSGSLVWITGFTSIDPALESYQNSPEWQEVSTNSFRNSTGRFRTYLSPNQILELFKNYQVLYHREYFGSWHSHANAVPEQHHSFEAIFRS
jgi:tellurite methyltransferase